MAKQNRTLAELGGPEYRVGESGVIRVRRVHPREGREDGRWKQLEEGLYLYEDRG